MSLVIMTLYINTPGLLLLVVATCYVFIADNNAHVCTLAWEWDL